MHVNIYIWSDESTPRAEVRKNIPWTMARAIGENAGYYKVQAVLPTGEVFTEWKQPLT